MSLTLAGCCTGRHDFGRPDFAGVPEAVNRSPDYRLPLSAADRADLVRFMAASGDRFRQANDPPPEPVERETARQYGPLLDWLQREVPSAADFMAGSEFARFFDAKFGVLSVHDARVGWARAASNPEVAEYFDLTTRDILAGIRNDFVFTFYRRGLEPIQPDPGEPPIGWTLAPESSAAADQFMTLVVFPKNHAIAEAAQ